MTIQLESKKQIHKSKIYVAHYMVLLYNKHTGQVLFDIVGRQGSVPNIMGKGADHYELSN